MMVGESLTERLRALRRSALFALLARMGERRRRILAWQAMPATGVLTTTFTRDGLTWCVPAGDPFIGFGLFVEGGFGQGAIDALLAWLQARGRRPGADDVIVDVGANVGSTCMPVVRACGCRAIAVEPVPSLFRMLQENVALNGMAGQFILVEAAVADARGRVTMALGSNIGAAKVTTGPARPADDGAPGARIDVLGMPLDDLIVNAGVRPEEVAVVWADVQGSETHVIETGTALWSRGVPLWAEFEPGLLAQHGGVDAFFAAASRHFDRYIEASRLLRQGAAASPQPISGMREVLSRTHLQTDVLLLPASFRASGSSPDTG